MSRDGVRVEHDNKAVYLNVCERLLAEEYYIAARRETELGKRRETYHLELSREEGERGNAAYLLIAFIMEECATQSMYDLGLDLLIVCS